MKLTPLHTPRRVNAPDSPVHAVFTLPLVTQQFVHAGDGLFAIRSTRPSMTRCTAIIDSTSRPAFPAGRPLD